MIERKEEQEEEIRRNGFSCAAEARHIAPVLDWLDEEELQQAIHAAIVAGPEAEQHEVQLREAVVARSDKEEP